MGPTSPLSGIQPPSFLQKAYPPALLVGGVFLTLAATFGAFALARYASSLTRTRFALTITADALVGVVGITALIAALVLHPKDPTPPPPPVEDGESSTQDPEEDLQKTDLLSFDPLPGQSSHGASVIISTTHDQADIDDRTAQEIEPLHLQGDSSVRSAPVGERGVDPGAGVSRSVDQHVRTSKSLGELIAEQQKIEFDIKEQEKDVIRARSLLKTSVGKINDGLRINGKPEIPLPHIPDDQVDVMYPVYAPIFRLVSGVCEAQRKLADLKNQLEKVVEAKNALDLTIPS